jgi:hemolysin D
MNLRYCTKPKDTRSNKCFIWGVIARDSRAPRSTGCPAFAGHDDSIVVAAVLRLNARISLGRTQMQVEENLVNLSPGMATTAEIKTGSRRIISYLLSLLLKYSQESLRER